MFSGLNAMPRSVRSRDGRAGSLASCSVQPEWHLKHSWYSAVTGCIRPSMREYVGAVPAGPLVTATPETPNGAASSPRAVNDACIAW